MCFSLKIPDNIRLTGAQWEDVEAFGDREVARLEREDEETGFNAAGDVGKIAMTPVDSPAVRSAGHDDRID